MSIHEKEISINIARKTASHYRSLGYDLTVFLDSSGKLIYGRKLIVKVEDLPHGSGERVTKVCDECGRKSKNIKYEAVLRARKKNNGKDLCSNCANKQLGIVKKNNVKYENSLEFYANENNKNYLLEEYSDKNIKKPNFISKGDNDKYFWDCLKCGSEYDSKVNSRTSGSGCPYCAGQKVNHTNCLWTTHPEIARLLKNKERGYKITAGRNAKEEFLCDDCNKTVLKKVHEVATNGFVCPKCSDGISYPEKFVTELLNQCNIDFEKEKSFDWSNIMNHENSRKKRYDFYLPSLNCIIETHGEQHYIEGHGYFKDNLYSKSEIDRLKENIAKENGIEYYIVIDCKKSNLEYIKNSILNSKLLNILDLEKINWTKCHEFACKSLVKIVCDIWNEGDMTTSEIAKKLHLSQQGGVVHYLKQGVELGWCKYDPKEEMRKSAYRTGKKNIRSIVQLTKDMKLLKIWESTKEASENTGINRAAITQVCRGRNKTAGGFRWAYEEDYNINKLSLQNT